MRARTTLWLALVACAAAAPASADVYKCTINGEIRYQDAPCPGKEGEQKPHLEIKEQAAPRPAASGTALAEPESVPTAEGSLSDPNLGSAGGEATPAQLRAAFEARAAARQAAPPVPAPEAGPPDRLNQLHGRIVEAQAAHRQLLREQRAALVALAEKHAGAENSEAAVAERREAEYQWRQRRLEAADRERALQAELSRLCPSGTMTVGGRLECR
mgnify:CR=1 FL=1